MERVVLFFLCICCRVSEPFHEMGLAEPIKTSLPLTHPAAGDPRHQRVQSQLDRLTVHVFRDFHARTVTTHEHATKEWGEHPGQRPELLHIFLRLPAPGVVFGLDEHEAVWVVVVVHEEVGVAVGEFVGVSVF